MFPFLTITHSLGEAAWKLSLSTRECLCPGRGSQWQEAEPGPWTEHRRLPGARSAGPGEGLGRRCLLFSSEKENRQKLFPAGADAVIRGPRTQAGAPRGARGPRTQAGVPRGARGPRTRPGCHTELRDAETLPAVPGHPAAGPAGPGGQQGRVREGLNYTVTSRAVFLPFQCFDFPNSLEQFCNKKLLIKEALLINTSVKQRSRQEWPGHGTQLPPAGPRPWGVSRRALG